MVSLFAITFNNAKAQKGGILQKDQYGAFTGNDWEDFLLGNRADDFNAKSNVKLDTYLEKGITPYISKRLNEKSISSAVDNSIVVTLPAGTEVHTFDIAGNPKTRTSLPGEKGFMHIPTGVFWLSFQCGNLVDIVLDKPKPAVPSSGTLTNYGGPKDNPNGNANNNTININPPGNNNSNRELSWVEGYGVYSRGRIDRSTDMVEDLTFAKMASTLGCCGGGNNNSTPATSVAYSQPVLYAQPASYSQSTQTQTNTNNGTQSLYIKPNWTDVAGAILQTANTAFNGINTFRGIRFENQPNYATTVYNNGWGSGLAPVATSFQGSSVLGYSSTGSSTGLVPIGGNGVYSNTWPR